jgi:copper transport protein
VPAIAQAHAFLVQSDPAAGARLGATPREITLRFSEPVTASGVEVSILRGSGGTVTLADPKVAGAVVHQSLPRRMRGVFVVSWRVLADDGHLSLGEFAFSVGSTAALPSVSAPTSATPASQVIASWLLFVGLGLAFGGLAAERFVWRGTGEPRAPVGAGLAVAVVGATWSFLLVAGAGRGGGIGASLHTGAVREAFSTRPGLLSGVTLVGLAIAAALVAMRARSLALAPLAIAIGAEAIRGHIGTSGKPWAVAAGVLHLATAALWVGALVMLVLVVVRSRDLRGSLADGVRRYSRFALPIVLVLLASGGVSALAELQRVGDLVHTEYGRALLVKTILVGLALALALSAKLFALPRSAGIRAGLLRRLTTGEALLLGGALVAAALLVNLPPPRGEAAPATQSVLGPPPLEEPAVRLADFAGQLVVGLTAGARELQLTVIPPGSAMPEDVKLTIDADHGGTSGADLFPRACGPGCFTIRYRPKAGETTIRTSVSARDWEGGTATFRLRWPPSPADNALLGSVIRTMRSVKALDLVERVSSGASSVASPTPYRLSGRDYLATEPFGRGAADVREVAREGELTVLAFALPGSSIWYRLWLDRSLRVRRELIVDPGHLIQRSFSYPAAAALVLPAPTAATPRPASAPFVAAAEVDELAVGVAARPRGRRTEITATVIGPDGNGAADVQVDVSLVDPAGGSHASAQPCGSGCYRATVPARSAPRRVDVTLHQLGREPRRVGFRLPARWPPGDATAIVRRATQVFRRLRSVRYDERLASSRTNVVRTTWTLEAPNRLRYDIRDGSHAVVIGSRRWDRDPGGRWLPSESSPLRQPTPAWVTAPDHASLIGSALVAGRPVWIVSFVQSSFPAWFTLWIDRTSYRTLELRMVAAAHFMHHRYGDFNAAPPIRPPR